MPKSNPIQDIIDATLVHLFSYETRRHQLCINNLAMRNGIRSPFLHGGRTFKPSNAIGRRVALDESLWEDMDRFLIDYNQVAWDSKKFWQTLFTLLEPCESLQDGRDAYPDFLSDLIPQFASLPRMKDEAWTIIGNPRVHRQYLTQREKMEFYANVRANPSLAQLLCVYNFEV